MPAKNPLEWAVFGVSLLLILAVAGLLGFEALRGGDTPPQVVVSPGTPARQGDLLAIPVLVENQGDTAAEDLVVAVTVRLADGSAEEAELSVPLLPEHASAEGQVTLPAAGEVASVEVRVVGYMLP